MAERLQPVLSRIDALKRQLYDALTNPRDYASMLGGRIQESGQAAKQLQSQAFADPRQPFKVTDEAALRQLTDMMMAGPLGFAPAGITAYHGSPYLFKQFDPMKVGTGEGAQAYGVGAGYTAEARPVAEEYRMMLARRDVTGDPVTDLANLAMKQKGKENDAIKFLQKEMAGYEKTGWPSPEYKTQYEQAIEKIKSGNVERVGYLYKGDIPDEILPNFLNWDQPLSQQSDEVKNVLKRRIVDVQPTDKFDMGGNARLRDNRNGQYDKTSSSPWILEAFDSSGTKTFGLTQKDVDRMFGSKNAKDLTGEQIYARLTQEMGSQQAASDYLNSIGIRGIRYLDQGSRREGKGTSNFIPFRPEDFKIQEINDIPLEDYIAKGLLSP